MLEWRLGRQNWLTFAKTFKDHPHDYSQYHISLRQRNGEQIHYSYAWLLLSKCALPQSEQWYPTM